MIARSVVLTKTNSPLDSLIRRVDEGTIDLDAPYQRGAVWGPERKVNLIRSLTMGLPVGTIFINEREYPHPATVIDGKQRLLAIGDFLHGHTKVPADWFPDDHVSDDVDGWIGWNDLTLKGQRSWRNNADILVCWTRYQGADFREREAELFDLINYGGVPQGESDLEPTR